MFQFYNKIYYCRMRLRIAKQYLRVQKIYSHIISNQFSIHQFHQIKVIIDSSIQTFLFSYFLHI
jgi:hypothetical protein